MNRVAPRSTPKKPRQLELPIQQAYQSNLNYFLMFSQAIHQGLCRDIGITAFGLWVVLRSYCRLTDGKVFLSLRDIQGITGLAIGTIRTAIDKLEDAKLLQVVTEGPQRRRYFVLDLLSFKAVENSDPIAAQEALAAGQKDGEISVRYVPSRAASDRRELEHWMMSGAAPATPNVQIIGAQFNGPVIILTGGSPAGSSVEERTIAALTAEIDREDLHPSVRATLEKVRSSLKEREPPTVVVSSVDKGNSSNRSNQ